MLDQEGASRLFNHVLQIWVNPEIERRIKKGTLQQHFKLHAAQIISFTDGRENLIMLNDEVRTEIIGIANRTIQPSEKVELDDAVREIKRLELTSKEYHNAGHLTFIKFKDKWVISFDFRYNIKMARDRLNAAEQFLKSARINRENNLFRPLAENLFAAIELCITAQLLLYADKYYTKNQHHTGTQKRYVEFIDIGNYKMDYKDVYLELMGLRRSGRYLQKDFYLSLDKADKFLEIVNDIMEYSKGLLI